MHPKNTKGFGHKKLHHRGKKKHGGAAEPDHDIYAGEHSNVVKEAEEKNRGGRAKKATGGPISIEGAGRSKPNLSRPGRKRGGRAMADKAPLTSASHVKNAEHHDSNTGMAESPTHVEGD